MYQEVLEAIKQTLEAELKSEIKSIFIMGGGFNGAEDITSFVKFAPCIGIGIESIPTNTRTNTNQLESMCNFNLFLITTGNNKPKGTKELEAYNLVEKLNLLIMNGEWGLKDVYATEQNSIVCTPFNGSFMYKSNIWMWEINWRQKLLLGTDRFVAEETGEFPKSWTAKTDITGDGKADETAESNILRSSNLRSHERSEEVEVSFDQLENQYKTQTKR